MVVEEPGKSNFESAGFLHINALYTYAQWMIDNAEESSAVLREAYRQAFRHWREDRGDCDLRLDLFRIVRNLIIRIREPGNRRRSALRKAAEAAPLLNSDSAQGATDPIKEPVVSFLENLIRRSVTLMPEEYGSAILLCDIDNLSYGEIGKIMNCPVEEVRRRVVAGQRLLREQLSKYVELLASHPDLKTAALTA